MSYTDINIPYSINTSIAKPMPEFFIPVLKNSVSYDVAVGYFSSKWIRDVAEGIAHLAANGGKSRWVISPELSEKDWLLLSECDEEEKNVFVNKITDLIIDKFIEELEINTRRIVSWLISDRILEFRIAIPINYLHGIFHAKIGIFKDEKDNLIAFSGSYNMTSAAETNWETIEIFTTLRDGEKERVMTKEKEFEKIWSNSDVNLSIYKPTDNAVNKFVKITKNDIRPYDVHVVKHTPKIPGYLLNEENKLKDHQELAINNWFKNNGRGIFNMATGSGKTVTSLAVAVRLTEKILLKNASVVIVITVPLRHLAEQWKKVAVEFRFTPIMCFSDYPDWLNDLSNKLLNLELTTSPAILVITLNATFVNHKFQDTLSNIKTNFLFIGDEAHNLGAANIRNKLPINAQFRAGLSATPIRKGDQEGTQAIKDYFGDDVINYGIKEAIDDGTLTGYYYYPELIKFTADEMDEYRELSNSIAKQFIYADVDVDADQSDSLKILLIKRSRLISNAENKLPHLKKLLIKNKDYKYNLVYVGDKINDEGEKQVEKYVKMIGNELNMNVNKFTSSENLRTRKKIIQDFESGDTQTLVAIRCLDEGVDIPRAENAYILASSSNPRQFVQRRGRVLRLTLGKKFARIYDFITIPSINKDRLGNESFNLERNLLRRELERVNEFADSAINSSESYERLRVLKQRLSLLDI